MRRSVQPLFRHSSILTNLSQPAFLLPRPSSSFVSSPFSLYHRPVLARSSTASIVSVYRSSAARPPLVRLLSTSLPSGGAPASPSVSSSNPSLGTAHSPSHTQSPPPPSQQQPQSSAPLSSSPPLPLPLQSEAGLAEPPPANESRLRRLFRQYGVVAVGSYLAIYVSTLGMLYVAIKERWLGGYDIQQLVDALGLSAHFEHIDPRKGDFAVAWLATKFTEPLRLAITAAITPTVARMLGRAPPKEGKGVRAKMEARIQEGVEQAKDRVEEKIRERSTKH